MTEPRRVIRLVTIWALGTFLAVLVLVVPAVGRPLKAMSLPQGQAASVAKYQLDDFASRWFGIPTLWRAPQLADTEFRFYDVSGSTPRELEDSMLAAKICDRFGPCLPDPGNPGGQALALQGTNTPGPGFCYSPQTSGFYYTYFILLPRWTPLPGGSVPIKTVVAWNALLSVLFTHEARHVAIAQADIAELNRESRAQPGCSAVAAFWSNPHLYDRLDADQNAFHAQLRADCRPELGCVPRGWMGW